MRNSFFLNSISSLPHHTALFIAYKFKIVKSLKYLDNKAHRRLLKGYDLYSFSESELNEYDSYFCQTVAWHGTGRYQYHSNKSVDILNIILREKSLTPSYDVYSIFINGKPMQSLSATRLRAIARSYADTHGSGNDEKNRYGSSLFWASYYYSWFYLRFFTIDIFRVVKRWKAWKKQASNHRGEIIWGKKVNKKARGVWDAFVIGSDIEGNYAIVFAIKEDVMQHGLPSPYNKYEIRYATNIPLEHLSHIEVPNNKLRKVRKLLTASNIEIKLFPIELGEYYASMQKYSATLGYK